MENVVGMFVLLKDGVEVSQLEGNSTGIWDRKGQWVWRQGSEYVAGLEGRY